MEFPQQCQTWVDSMRAGSEKEQRVLHNLLEDPCIDDGVASAFVEALGKDGTYTAPAEAHRRAIDVIRADPDRFLRHGRVVPPHLCLRLLRLEDVQSLGYRVRGALDRLGLTERELFDDASEETLRAITTEWDGDVELGNRLGVVWVTDADNAEPMMGDLTLLSDRLGRSLDPDETQCVVCVYNRDAMGGTLHVPRALDAMDSSQFQPNKDCSADTGWSRPINGSPSEGLPEAVHPECTLVPEIWELRPI